MHCIQISAGKLMDGYQLAGKRNIQVYYTVVPLSTEDMF